MGLANAVLNAQQKLQGAVSVPGAKPDGSILDGNGTLIRRSTSSRAGLPLFGPERTYSAPATAVGSGCTLNSSGAVTINGETYFQINATATSAVNNWVEIQLNSVTGFSCDTFGVEFVANDIVNVANIIGYMGTVGYAQFVNATKTLAQDGDGVNPFMHRGRLSMHFCPADWAKGGFVDSINTKIWRNAKIRISITNGTTVTFSLRSMSAAIATAKAKLVICSDDGYSSWIRSGVPILERYGIYSTMAIIMNQVGNAGGGFCSLDELKEFVARGNTCITHGPLLNSSNIFAAPYTTHAERINDINTGRDYLIANGLTDAKGAQCYIFPQGVYGPADGDASFLDYMQANGYKMARSAIIGTASPIQRSQYIRAISPSCHQRLTLPIIGHTYQGAIGTANDVAETTNINAVIATVQALAANSADGTIMLHKCVAPGGTVSGVGSIEIEMDRLEALCDAIRTLVRAGSLETCFFQDLIP